MVKRYFVLRTHDSSQDFSYKLIHMQYVGIFTIQTIDNILNNQVRRALFLSGDIHEGIYI